MRKVLVPIIALALAATSCRTLTSVTTIKANDSFLLGNNPHNEFKVRLKNVSDNDVTVFRAPIAGGRHSAQVISPGRTVTVQVEKNTALVVDNKSTTHATVELLVTGDAGHLSMGYKN